ncbi:T-complex protein 11-like protein 1 [Uloborus diversus]|uniref:T-complex protein 11-like protein 1 n=1 Tax=Uloborus diversus TaxID=327109 RepID=UPI00240A0874|nr:T-complex protein 11-like protein 1 [Uloborus diversus]
MALAHEIAVNSDFKLQQKLPESNIQAKITEIFHKAFWDILQEQLSSTPPDCSQAIVLLAEIKEILLSLLMPHSTRLRNEINDVLDVDLVKQQAEKGTVDIGSYAQFIISTMARLCAPARDENIQKLRQLNDVVPLYKGILETLDLMKIDFMNYTLINIRPHIQRHSIEYEKNKFEEILKSLEGLSVPVDGLKFTRIWLQNVYQEISKETNASEVPNSLILRKAYIKILQWKDTDNFPETLHLDHARFIEMKENLTVMILTASVILVTYSNVGPAIQGITDFKELLKSHVQILLADIKKISSVGQLEEKMETVALQVVKDVNLCLDQHGYTALEEEKEKTLISLIKQISTEDHSVRQLLSKRILEFLELTLHSSTMLKIPPGLSSLQKELSSFAGQFLSLVRHNTAVFIEYYDRILNDVKHIKL